MTEQTIRFGVIGCGLMAREFASATQRWAHLTSTDVRPRLVAVADAKDSCLCWFTDNMCDITTAVTDYRELLANPEVDAVYCAVPHHLHTQIYGDIIRAGKHLLGEKPFGIDLAANEEILAVLREHPQVFARCSSEFPFYPGAYQIVKYIQEGRFGKIIEVESGLWHSSDLDPNKPINWKRMLQFNGEYGCLGDLGLHPLHIPLRFGWLPANVRGLLSKIVTERPDGKGGMAPCETWDNAILACEVQDRRPAFPDADQHQAHRARRGQHLVHQGPRHRILGRVQHEISQDAADDDLPVRQTTELGDAGHRLRQRLPDDHRRHLRVRLFRQHPADVRGVLR